MDEEYIVDTTNDHYAEMIFHIDGALYKWQFVYLETVNYKK